MAKIERSKIKIKNIDYAVLFWLFPLKSLIYAYLTADYDSVARAVWGNEISKTPMSPDNRRMTPNRMKVSANIDIVDMAEKMLTWNENVLALIKGNGFSHRIARRYFQRQIDKYRALYQNALEIDSVVDYMFIQLGEREDKTDQGDQ